MASPPKLSFLQWSTNALQPCTLEDLRVWDRVLPGDAKQSAQAIDMEYVQLPCVPTVDCPCIAGIEESGHDYSSESKYTHLMSSHS